MSRDDCRALAVHFGDIAQATKERGKRFATIDLSDIEEVVELLGWAAGVEVGAACSDTEETGT